MGRLREAFRRGLLPYRVEFKQGDGWMRVMDCSDLVTARETALEWTRENGDRTRVIKQRVVLEYGD